ncbi:colicin immunity domain-containing protein [Serratia marcescens]|uniref:colicin immunity domain-containing protein n=1 Tax=Serratia marcescens TaxID=615 RepID=UPI0032046FCF
MSRMRLVELGKEFVENKISAEGFSESIVKERRKLYGYEEKDKQVDKCSGELFILADCYNSASDRAESELDEVELKKEVITVLKKFDFI